MKIGVISDIHGDYEALDNALRQLESLHQVTTVLCAGDLVGRGPDPDRVVQTIRDRNIATVRGNHDEWSYGLSADNRAYLKALPLEWRGDFDGASLYMTHGKPGNNLWGLYRDHVSNTLLNMMLVSLKVDVLITGHTHVPLYVRVQNGCVINPGSLYTFNNVRPTSHSYGVLSVPDMSFLVYDLNGQEQVILS
ncbi:MAG: metallophosphoesterase family protein [Anaerolineae bacterium]|jgi:putative phosphoesterase|uniref:metallophosphoesterase family protein n=1 Tax=Candidatus Flexifilum breve TaxID=3140694 RepID=UPI001AD39F31|nr:metallophosphoesterase family protein [Chloroflexota bacterium]MBK9748800.1 metallophosphoesterase family protein [Chloroflexota bacterium]MBN8635493.1 metallophosphoesterase family protein [Anaerolineae bacterium]